MTHVPTLRPMGLLEIVDQTFRLYRANFLLFFGIAAMVFIPIGLLQAASPELVILAAFLVVPANLVVTGALTKAVSDRYMGDPATIGGSYAYIARRLGAFILTVLLSYLLVLGGLILLIIGAIIFGFWVAFVTQVFVIEDKHYATAISRSRFLIGQGVWAEVLVLGIMTGFIALLIQYVAMLPTMIISEIGGTNVETSWALTGILNGIAQTLAMPIGLVATILLYYDSRIRKEGFDLEILARELGKELPAAAAPPPAPMPGSPETPPSAPADQPPPASGAISPPAAETPLPPEQSTNEGGV